MKVATKTKKVLYTKLSKYRKPAAKLGKAKEPYQPKFGESTAIPFPSPTTPRFRFIDLFAGIGGFRMAFQKAGGKCVFSSDWDKYSQITYAANYGETPVGDLRNVSIPDNLHFDVLCAGFPCQPFSLAGVSKKNSLGRKHGFDDERQGTLFFEIEKILRKYHPQAFLLENVKNLLSHDNKRTYRIICDTLRGLGYRLFPEVIDARGVVPQHRERIYIVGFLDHSINFEFPKFSKEGPKLETILEDNSKVHSRYTLTDNLWKYLQAYARKHAAAGNGFGFGLVTGRNVSRTLSARYHKDGAEILVSQGAGKNPRRLTPKECAALMGYPPEFIIPVSDTQAYRQFGNSVVVKVVEPIAKRIAEHLKKEE